VYCPVDTMSVSPEIAALTALCIVEYVNPELVLVTIAKHELAIRKIVSKIF